MLYPLPKDKGGQFLYPTIRCGVLPYFINDDRQIIWGCVESNRVGPIVISPAAGIQDLIIEKEGHQFTLEVGKPLPDLGYDFLTPFVDKLLRDLDYQAVLNQLESNGFNIYLEEPRETALHELQEEHGLDLRNGGNNLHLLNRWIELPIQTLSGKQGATAQSMWVAFLKNSEGVALKHTEKVEKKIRRNMGKAFYEKGCWGSLDSFREAYRTEKEKYTFSEEMAEGYTSQQLALIEGVLQSYEETLLMLEQLEARIQCKQDLESSESLLFFSGRGRMAEAATRPVP